MKDTKTCLVHNVEMDKHTKDGKSWYSHEYLRKDGRKIWCSGNGWKNTFSFGPRYLKEPEQNIDS